MVNPKLVKAFDKVAFVLLEADLPQATVIKLVAQMRGMLGIPAEPDQTIKPKLGMAAAIKELMDDPSVDRSKGSGGAKAPSLPSGPKPN
jgi:hypothetical protein